MGVKENPAMADRIARTAITITNSIREKPSFFKLLKDSLTSKFLFIFIFLLFLKIYV
tara:strand:+ start:1051 stop:1221 length:171 start_codon:yes stop_codon:yes gene_type:complete